MEPPTAHSEARRLRALRSTQLLDSLAEPAFDRLTRLAVTLIGAPVAIVSLVDEDRQFFKSAVGLPEPWATLRQTPLTHSFCLRAVRDRSTLVVDDARAHPALRENLAIRDLGVVAYAGIPLLVDDEALGAFCVIDDKPRAWSEAELDALQDLAGSAVAEIELRVALGKVVEQQRLTDALLDGLGDAVLAIDRDRTFLAVNEAARRIFLRPEVGAALLPDWGSRHLSLHEDGSRVDPGEGALTRALAGQPTNGLTFSVQKEGATEPVWVEACGRPVLDHDGAVRAAVAVYRDVTDKKRHADLLQAERQLFETTLSNIEDGVSLLDAERRTLLCNDAFARMFGLSKEGSVGLERREFLEQVATFARDGEALIARLERPTDGEPEEFELDRPHPRTLRRTWTPVTLPTRERGFLVTWYDVTAQKQLVRERERQVLVDPLTGLGNRRAADEALAVEVTRHRRHGTPMSVAMFDVDHFKGVNDHHGHAVGDEVLRRVAATLGAGSRLNDTVARWGGEEFLAVLSVPLEGARVFAERGRAAIASHRIEPVGHVTISAGIAELAADEDPAAVVGRADERLYEAKRAGRNRVAG